MRFFLYDYGEALALKVACIFKTFRLFSVFQCFSAFAIDILYTVK